MLLETLTLRPAPNTEYRILKVLKVKTSQKWERNVVFGLEVNGDARAYPKRLQTHRNFWFVLVLGPPRNPSCRQSRGSKTMFRPTPKTGPLGGGTFAQIADLPALEQATGLQLRAHCEGAGDLLEIPGKRYGIPQPLASFDRRGSIDLFPQIFNSCLESRHCLRSPDPVKVRRISRFYPRFKR